MSQYSSIFELGQVEGVLPVDVVFNPALAQPLLDTISFFSDTQTETLVVSELREADMLTHFLDKFQQLDGGAWDVRRVTMPTLPPSLQPEHTDGPFVVWHAQRRASAPTR